MIGMIGGNYQSPTLINPAELNDPLPTLKLIESDQAANEKLWEIDVQGKLLQISTRNDADNAGVVALKITRGSTTAVSDVAVLSSSLTLGSASTQTGIAKFVGTTSGTVTLTVGAAAGTWTFTLPATAGTADYALTTNGSGTASWAQISLTAGVTGVLPLANGGTNAALTASNGGIFYSTASAGAILSGTATANQVLLSGSSAAPAWSTATYPATTTINQLLYSSSANTVAGLATANYGVLNTSSSGVPSVTATPTISTSLTIGVASTATGQLLLAGTTSGTVTMTVGAAAGTWTLTLPNSAGTADYVLKTDGAGATAWISGQSIDGLKTSSSPTFVTGTFTTRVISGVATNAADLFYAGASASDAAIRIDVASATASDISRLKLSRSLGTQASRSNVANTNPLGSVLWQAYSGATGMWDTAEIRAVVDGPVTDNQRPAVRQEHYTNPLNTAQTLRLTISGNGSWTVDADTGSAFNFNEAGVDVDFRVESDGNANAFLVDGGTNQVKVGSGTGTAQAVVGGALNVNVTAVGNVDAGEDDLITYTLPANTLDTNGRTIRMRAWGTTANNANAKTLKAYFGTAVILTNALTANVAGVWWVEALVVRTASNAQDSVARLEETGVGNSDVEVGTATQTDSGTIAIKLTGEATATNDIVQEGMIVEVLN